MILFEYQNHVHQHVSSKSKLLFLDLLQVFVRSDLALPIFQNLFQLHLNQQGLVLFFIVLASCFCGVVTISRITLKK